MHETAQIHLAPDADLAAFASALEALATAAIAAGAQAGPAANAAVDADAGSAPRRALVSRHAANLPGSWGAGHYTWDGAPGASTALASLPGVERIDATRYTVIGGGWRAPRLDGGVKRTLLLRVLPGAAAGDIARFEQDLLRMPHYMPGILNWTLGRCPPGSAWTHVWQQEFRDANDLLGEYMVHPYHWAWVDRWFDPEHPDCMVDGVLSHAYCPMTTSILAALQPEVAA